MGVFCSVLIPYHVSNSFTVVIILSFYYTVLNTDLVHKMIND